MCNSGTTDLNPILEEIDMLTNDLSTKNIKIIELTDVVSKQDTAHQEEVQSLKVAIEELQKQRMLDYKAAQDKIDVIKN